MTGDADIYLTGATVEDHDFIASLAKTCHYLIHEIRRCERFEWHWVAPKFKLTDHWNPVAYAARWRRR